MLPRRRGPVGSGATLPDRSERGDEMVLNIMGPGEIFGELAPLDGSPRSASVVVLQPTSVFVLPRRQLLKLMSSNPGLADGFLAARGLIAIQGRTARLGAGIAAASSGWTGALARTDADQGVVQALGAGDGVVSVPSQARIVTGEPSTR